MHYFLNLKKNNKLRLNIIYFIDKIVLVYFGQIVNLSYLNFKKAYVPPHHQLRVKNISQTVYQRTKSTDARWTLLFQNKKCFPRKNIFRYR